MSEVERARAEVDAIERAMLAGGEPATRELRPARAAALEDLAQAEAAEAEQRERRELEAVREALRALRGEPGAFWAAKHRRHHSDATKVRLLRRIGLRAYPGFR